MIHVTLDDTCNKFDYHKPSGTIYIQRVCKRRRSFFESIVTLSRQSHMETVELH